MRALIRILLLLFVSFSCVGQDMMMPRQGLGIANRQLIPELVQQNRTDYASSTSYSFTITSAPIEGNLMTLAVGGSQNRTPTFPGGWTPIPMNGATQTLYIAYKIAGAGETQSITITFNLALQGNIIYTEFKNVDTVNPLASANPGTGVPFASVTSAAYGNPFDINARGVMLQDIQFTAAPFWTANNSFIYTAGGATRHDVGYKIYGNPATGESTTWSGASATGSIGMAFFIGKIQ